LIQPPPTLTESRADAAIYEEAWHTTMAAFPIMDKIKGYAVKLLNALYGASVASVVALCAVIFLAVVWAMAISVKLIDAPPMHPPQ
jgi:hypothetical protein